MRVAVYCYNWAQWHERFKHLFYVYVNINTFCSKQDFSSKYNRLRDRLVVRLPIKWRCWNSHSRSESLVISTSTYPLQFSPSLDWNTVLLYSVSGNQTRIFVFRVCLSIRRKQIYVKCWEWKERNKNVPQIWTFVALSDWDLLVLS